MDPSEKVIIVTSWVIAIIAALTGHPTLTSLIFGVVTGWIAGGVIGGWIVDYHYKKVEHR